MPTPFTVCRLKRHQIADDIDQYLRDTKISGMRGATWCAGFKTWKVDSVSGLAVSEPEGATSLESPCAYFARIEVSDLDAMLSYLGTETGQKFVASWSVYIDPETLFSPRQHLMISGRNFPMEST